MGISRRQLAGIVLVGTAAVPISAQAPPKPPAEGDVEAARAQQRATAQAIARIPLPMSTEPAFQFKA
jgi:hypothetical protein